MVGISNPCGYTALRFLNFVGGVPVLYAVLSLYPTKNYLKINILSLPLLYTYNFLFYTDVWSTVLVLAAFMVVLRWPNIKGTAYSNIIGFLSLWFRQTNIMWVFLLGVLFVDLRRQKRERRQKNRALGGLVREITSFVHTAISDWLLLLPFAANGVIFLAFLKWNGGITFGDKENHQVSQHFVQVFYCVLFLCFFTVPVWISPKILVEYADFCGLPKRGSEKPGNKSDIGAARTISPLGTSARILTTLGSYAVIALIIKKFTVVHPFLLADNRHYTFYIYRRLLSKKWSVFLMAPAYHFCTWLVTYLLHRTHQISRTSLSPLTIIAFFGITAATLIPSPLFEPRYFIIPLVLFRIFIAPADNIGKRHLAEFTWYTTINVIFFVIFFSYQFTWLTQPGIQRIIW